MSYQVFWWLCVISFLLWCFYSGGKMGLWMIVPNFVIGYLIDNHDLVRKLWNL